jgi:peptidoglycan/LPS O-acetylase OafA/YrhL
MNYASIVLIIVSLGTLGLGFQAWRMTSSRSIFLNTLVGSGGLLFAAYLCSVPGRGDAAYIIPFMVAMLFVGGGLGALWRSRKESILRLPSTLLLAIAVASLYASFAAYST